MKNGLKMIQAAGCAIVLIPLIAAAEDKTVSSPSTPTGTAQSPIVVKPAAAQPLYVTPAAATPPTPKPYQPILKDRREDMSYAMGLSMGSYLKRSLVDLDLDVLAAALRDAQAGRPLKLTEAQAQEAGKAFQVQMRAKTEEERVRLAEKNRKLGEAFLAENKTKADVKTHVVTLAGGKTAEFQYKVITEGSGPSPRSNDVVTVNYRGRLINGTEFDNSSKRPTPFKRPANSLIKGWTEALQLMKVGSKWELYLPSTLAYGDRASGPAIEPGSTLIFDMELVAVDPPIQPHHAASSDPGRKASPASKQG
jgi:FKBP-type peptidyl-prolyl cis-trans isomerase